MIRALVITEFPPMGEAFLSRGNYQRFSLFMSAIRGVADAVDMLHLWPSDENDIVKLDAEQSARFGVPISTHIVPARERPCASNAVSGIWSIYEQDQFFRCSGKQHAARVAELLARTPDFVFVHRLSAMLPVIRSGCRPARMFFDLDDLEHLIRVQIAFDRPGLLRKLLHLAWVPAIVAAERKGAAQAYATFICSEIDRRRLRLLGIHNTTLVPNAITVPDATPALPTEPRILFLGFCHVKANIDAAERLVRRIFPKVRSLLPHAKLLIAGSGSAELPSAQERPEGVEYLGYVDDLTALYASARLVCCPGTHGSGTRIKLIEAAAHRRPLVATKLAAEGLDFRDGSEILLRDEDDAIAAACVQLLTDERFSLTLGSAARTLTRAKYDAVAVRNLLIRILLDSMNNSGTEPEPNNAVKSTPRALTFNSVSDK